MQKKSFIALLGATLLVLGNAHAANTDTTAVIDKVQVTAKTSYQLAPQEFDTYKGRYEFDEGTAVRVWQQQNRFYAQIADQPVQQLFSKAPGVFESSAGATLRFSEHGDSVSVSQFGKLLVASNASYFAKR